MAFAAPVLAVDYKPGVSVGQYVKYSGGAVESLMELLDFDWTKLEVVDVSGKEVTLRSSGQFKNGTTIPESGSDTIYNVETGKMNTWYDSNIIPAGPIIAANLDEDDVITLYDVYWVDKTEIRSETRTYLGVSRSVNILNTTFDLHPGESRRFTTTYDKASGMMLEIEVEVTDPWHTPTTWICASASVIETNIFDSSTPSAAIPAEYLYVLVAAVVIAVAVAAIGVFKKRSK